MDEKKKTLSSLWNQLSTKLNASAQKNIERHKHDNFEQAATASSLGSSVHRPSTSRATKIVTQVAADNYISLSSQKFASAKNLRVSTLNDSDGSLHKYNMPSGKNKASSQNGLQTANARGISNLKTGKNLKVVYADVNSRNEGAQNFSLPNNSNSLPSHKNGRETGQNRNSRGRNNVPDFRRRNNNRNFNVKGPEETSFNERKNKPISFSSLSDLMTKETNEILFRISPQNSNFMELIRQKDIRTDMMALVLIVLGKVCSSNLKQTLSTFLNIIRGNTEFLVVSIQKFLVTLRPGAMKDFHLDSLSYLTIFLQKLQHTFRFASSDSISMLLPLIKSKCDTLLKNHSTYADVLNRLQEIEDENENFLKDHTKSDIDKASRSEIEQLIEPPENFRSLSILPTVDDIYSNAFLRCNVVEGKYMNAEHYLDVQFRLLREDYVKPLRDGIGEYLQVKKAGKSVKNLRDVRVYENVHVIKQEFVNGSMLHIAELSGTNFSKINWEYSKRFLSGSLLCLSSDNFQTMLFASVARRIPEKLKKGLLLIRFERITREVLNISPLTSFVIIETSAYFEAYRYNLKALHDLNEEALPLKRYIINVEPAVNHPSYLNLSTVYDMRPLLLPINSTNIRRVEVKEGVFNYQYEFPSEISNVSKSVQVLKDSCWPSASDLNLDDSQYFALKAAVTKEFVVIQGPPGTGKTYIGLRIVQLLLHNIDKWLIPTENTLPFLVVCYTNHALDQFLEGMMNFTDKIVRIGGRVSNEALSNFQLSKIRQSPTKKLEIPKYLGVKMFHQIMLIQSHKRGIDVANRLVQKSLRNVLGEKELRKYIPELHYASLMSVIDSPNFRQFNLTDDGYIIHDWLGIRTRFGSSNIEVPYDDKEFKAQVTDFEPAASEIDDGAAAENSDDEGDIEFIEAQRDIDDEDLTGISFDIEDPEKDEVPVDDSGWQIQGGRKQRLKFIKNGLNNSRPLMETEAMKINNVWMLPVPERWNLYKFWLENMIVEKQQESLYLQEKLKAAYEELEEIRTERDIKLLQSAHVIGMTTTGAAKYRHIVQRLNPQILIVEEAAEILESHIVTSLAPNTKHVILIGDHQQLRPSPTVYLLAVEYNLNISLFERMIKNKMECFRLCKQHRMRPDIADLIVPHIYKDLENHESVFKYENIAGVSKNMYFITHNYAELHEEDSKSKVNEHEANFLVKLCNYFIQQGYDSSQITVLTTYSGQLKVMRRKKSKSEVMQNVRFTVVDNYQGEENDIILISFVRSNEDGEIGFLKVANRVCVALSRAKKGLFCIGNFELLAEISDLWKNITKTLLVKKAIGPSLQLMCQNHPEVCNIVATDKDFESVPEGGCTKVCEYRLSCGHVCSLMCHPYDKMHENVRCHKKCSKTCKEGHECPKKCFEDCGPCKYSVSKKLDLCGHTIKVPCHKQHSAVECYAQCDKILACGHTCSNKCRDACTTLCKKFMTIKSPICNHKVTVECQYKNSPEVLMKICKSPCQKVLDCEHICKGNCSKCHQGRLHVVCNLPCKRILVCGHECKSNCAKSCPPCKYPCENRCSHSKCPKECGEPCVVCTEKCDWWCRHKVCSKLCGEVCTRIPCNEPCPKRLPCGHLCIGFCGEPCPDKCRICDSEEVKEIFFGTEDDDDARFIQLEDCHHILEMSGLDEWLKVQSEGDHQIQMKTCPKCKTVIRTNLRYGNVVKECLKKVEIVKQKHFGSDANNELMRKQLLEYIEDNEEILKNLRDGSVYNSWEKILSSKKSRSIQEITLMENIIKITQQLADVRFTIPLYINQSPPVKERLNALTRFVEASEIWLFDFIFNEILTASELQLQQLSWEFHRLRLSYQLLKFTKERIVPNVEKCVSALTSCSPFGENDVKAFCTNFKILAESCGSAVINISEMEKQSILRAMNLSKGHWYQCPNGHVYCITECGGAMVESRCPECNERIGGRNHALLSSNRVASDMDGARQSAWPGQIR